jgi:hypothetical protein
MLNFRLFIFTFRFFTHVYVFFFFFLSALLFVLRRRSRLCFPSIRCTASTSRTGRSFAPTTRRREGKMLRD